MRRCFELDRIARKGLRKGGSVRPGALAGAIPDRHLGFCLGFRLGLCRCVFFDEPVLLKQLAFNRREDVGMLFEEGARVVTALPDALFTVAIPGAGLVDDACFDAEIEHVAGAADALTEEDIELAQTERGERACS